MMEKACLPTLKYIAYWMGAKKCFFHHSMCNACQLKNRTLHIQICPGIFSQPNLITIRGFLPLMKYIACWMKACFPYEIYCTLDGDKDWDHVQYAILFNHWIEFYMSKSLPGHSLAQIWPQFDDCPPCWNTLHIELGKTIFLPLEIYCTLHRVKDMILPPFN